MERRRASSRRRATDGWPARPRALPGLRAPQGAIATRRRRGVNDARGIARLQPLDSHSMSSTLLLHLELAACASSGADPAPLAVESLPRPDRARPRRPNRRRGPSTRHPESASACVQEGAGVPRGAPRHGAGRGQAGPVAEVHPPLCPRSLQATVHRGAWPPGGRLTPRATGPAASPCRTPSTGGERIDPPRCPRGRFPPARRAPTARAPAPASGPPRRGRPAG